MMRNSLLLLLLTSFLLSSCITQKKKEFFAYGYFRENPVKLAELCADQFPPKDSIAPGKEILKTDTLFRPGVEIPCPPVVGQKTVYIKCPPAEIVTNTVFKTDTIFRENTARVNELRLKNNQLTVELILSEKKVDEGKKYKWASGILVLMLGAFILKRFIP